ncbi:helix-turn-helix domain-containing protein [Legionella maioricensis]|uniref:Helix-turn-helix domain-containing protein n=1 Tax=Legionella maioricensis TaxID=2896528 RepID=A0A9X2D2F7_9GAMM|nr:helix-turn-helix domain-containing protein [Legionella maioricensis]MCL9685022.1 helix-turn-helix domain-containing protein [Legionella maioricensis]MCL9688081.1 helix-turn-helix domain-containing protein [Legionella maioricensis]
MNTTPSMDEINNPEINNPGVQLSSIRQQKGYSIEYVASKLHLRTRIIELIETGEFNLLPEPVFVKGYLRAYSKLLGVSPDPFLAVFDTQYVFEKKPERALWQSKRESHKAEHVIRWFTIVFAVGVMVAVGVWWQKNRDNQPVYSAKKTVSDLSLNQTTNELKLTDLSKMKSLLAPSAQMSPLEKKGV